MSVGTKCECAANILIAWKKCTKSRLIEETTTTLQNRIKNMAVNKILPSIIS